MRGPGGSVARAAPAGDLLRLTARLADLGPPSELRRQLPALLAQALGFDRVLLSSIDGGVLHAESWHDGARRRPGDALARLQQEDVPLGYPLAEGEVVRRRRTVLDHAAQGRPPHAFEDVLAWGDVAIAPVVLDGRVTGLLHADRHETGGGLTEADAAALDSAAGCFSLVYERAVLRQRVHDQRDELRRIAHWADARSAQLGDRSITLSAEPAAPARPGSAPASPSPPSGVGEHALRDLLTRRELEVLRLMVGGETNAAIAKDLVVSEGTVKYHVKNILRKLHAANRAEAIARYLRMTLNHDSGRAALR